MFEAVLLNLQGVVKGTIELLHCNLDWTLQGNPHMVILEPGEVLVW